jgi:hypothetical protein
MIFAPRIVPHPVAQDNQQARVSRSFCGLDARGEPRSQDIGLQKKSAAFMLTAD